MRIFFKLLVYTLALSLLLGYLSYRVYINPSQLSSRLEQSLGRFFLPRVTLEGCAQEFLGDPTIGRLRVAAEPALLEATILTLEDVQLHDPSGQLGRRLRRRPGTGGLDVGVPPLRVRHAKLNLDHESSGINGGRWNFDAVPRWTPILASLESNKGQVSIERVLVQLQEVVPPRKTFRWIVAAREAEVRSPGDKALVVDADLTECEYWSEGLFHLTWSPVEGFTVRGGVDDFMGLGPWLGVLPEAQKKLWNTFAPVGRWDVELKDLRLPRNGPLTFRARVNNYDTTLTLPSLGLDLQHLEGPMEFSEWGCKVGKKEVGEGALAELLGVRVAVEGAVDLTKGKGDLRLELPLSPLEAVLSSVEAPGSYARSSLLSFLHPVGQVEGGLSIHMALGREATLDGSVRLSEVELPGLPVVKNLEGLIQFQRASEGATVGKGKGLIQVHNALLSGLGRAEGSIQFDWDATRLKFDLTDIKLGGNPLGDTGEAPEESRSGRAFGKVSWGWKTGILQSDLRWLDAVLVCGFLRAGDFDGNFKQAAPGEPGFGEVDLGQITVPAGSLWPQGKELTFHSGRCRFRMDPGHEGAEDPSRAVGTGAGKPRVPTRGRTLRVTSCKFFGEGQTLRATGTISLSGEVDFLVFIAEGASHRMLEQLPDNSPPSEWKEAAKGGYRAFRIRGNIGSPEVREVGGRDPAFLVGK